MLEEVPEPSYQVQRIIDSGIVGVGYGHADGTISDVNDAFLKMIGHTREELLQGGLTWHQLTAPEYWERDDKAIAELEAHGFCRPYEKEYVLGARRLPVQVAMASVEPATADTDHVALIVDLTVQKEAQAALAAGHAELEKRVAERTRQLRESNERLLQEMKRREAVQSALMQSQKLEALGQLT